MLVTFESEVGRVTLFGEVAAQLIRMMGRTGSIPSALLAAEIPEALAKLEQALETVGDTPTQQESDEEDEAAAKKASISLRHRAMPLIKLLEDAAKQGSDVMWEHPGSRPLQF